MNMILCKEINLFDFGRVKIYLCISFKNLLDCMNDIEYKKEIYHDNRNNLIKTIYDNGLFEINTYDNLNRLSVPRR